MPLYIGSTDINDISEVIDDASLSVVAAYKGESTKHYQHDVARPDQLAESLDRFIEVMVLVEVEEAGPAEAVSYMLDEEPLIGEEITPRVTIETSEVGNHGLKLLETLGEWAGMLHLPKVQHQIQVAMVTVSLWVVRHGGSLDHLDSVVNTLTALANTTSDREFLSELSSIMGELAEAVPGAVKIRQSRSWRTLNISRGIVASRSYDPGHMTSAFDQLARNLPKDASIFFEEGVLQMDSLGYPDSVREIMSKYFYRYTASTLH